jgi:hypothetical protein
MTNLYLHWHHRICGTGSLRNGYVGFKSSYWNSSPKKRNRSFIRNLFWNPDELMNINTYAGPSATFYLARITEYIKTGNRTQDACMQYRDCNSHTDCFGWWVRWQKHEAQGAARSWQSLDKLTKKQFTAYFVSQFGAWSTTTRLKNIGPLCISTTQVM